MVSNLLLEMQSCTKVEFHLSEQYGEDLSEDAWQYIFAVDLLCSHMKWDWTHANVIRYCGEYIFQMFSFVFFLWFFFGGVFFFPNSS